MAIFGIIMEKVSKSQIKLVKSLQHKKFRDELGLFVAEGEKCVSELTKAFELKFRVQSTEYRVQTDSLLASPKEIEQMSGLKSPQGVIGVFKKNLYSVSETVGTLSGEAGLVLCLDGVQDPGNLGTIIRTCDWFGVHDIVCSPDTADCYNPKVVQATMGALARVRVHYVDLPRWLSEQHCPIIGTLLEGRNMYEELSNSQTLKPSNNAVIVMGNEGNGISPAVRKLVTLPIRIPSYPKNAETSESLNVSIATAIVLAEFRRKDFSL